MDNPSHHCFLLCTPPLTFLLHLSPPPSNHPDLPPRDQSTTLVFGASVKACHRNNLTATAPIPSLVCPLSLAFYFLTLFHFLHLRKLFFCFPTMFPIILRSLIFAFFMAFQSLLCFLLFHCFLHPSFHFFTNHFNSLSLSLSGSPEGNVRVQLSKVENKPTQKCSFTDQKIIACVCRFPTLDFRHIKSYSSSR